MWLEGRFDVVVRGALTWLEGALRRGWRGRFDVVGVGASTSVEAGRLECLEGDVRCG